MSDPTKEKKDELASAGEPLVDVEEVTFETRKAGDSKKNAQEGKPSNLGKAEQQVLRMLKECGNVFILLFVKRINRIARIISGEIAYWSNFWSNTGSLFEQLGSAAAGVAQSMFFSALCSFRNSSASISGLSALKSALFLALSFAPEHKMKAQEEQIKRTIDATKNLIDQIEKMLDSHKPSAPPDCFDNQSKVAALVIEDFKEGSLENIFANSGENEVTSLDINRSLTETNSLSIYNILERTAKEETDITSSNTNNLYSDVTIFPRPRVAGFSEEFPTRYYIDNNNSDSGISTNFPVSLSTTDSILSGELGAINLGDNYNLYFKWREVGASSWNTTESINTTEEATFQREITGLSNTLEYEYKAFVDVLTGDTVEETRSGEIVRIKPSNSSITRSFTWGGSGRAVGVSTLIEGVDKDTKPNIKESIIETVNGEEYTLQKPASLTENDLLLVIDNSHRSNRELEIDEEFTLEDKAAYNESNGLPKISVHSKIATSSEPSEYKLNWSGEEGKFIDDHENSNCHKGLLTKMDELGESLKNYDNEAEQEQIEKIGEEIEAVADCIDFVMDRADELLQDDPEKNVRQIEDYDSIKDQLDTIEEAGFDTSAENMNLKSLGRFLDKKQNELENMKSPDRDLDDDEKFKWGGSEILSDNMKLEFLKNIRDTFKEIRKILATFKRFMQELSGMNVMMPGQVSIDAMSDFIDGLNSELFDVADLLQDARVEIKIAQAEKIGEVSDILGMLDDLGDDLFNPDNIDTGTDFLDGINDKIGYVQDLFSIIFRAIPYILYGENIANFISKYEELFNEPLHSIGAVEEIIKDLKSESQSVEDYYEDDLKTWEGVFTIFTAWFEEDTTVNVIDEAMFYMTRVIENLNRVIEGKEAIKGSEVDRFTKELARIFNEIRDNIPLDKIVGILELYLSVYQMVNFFNTDHIEQLEKNLDEFSEALPEDVGLSNSLSNGDFESLLNSQGGIASCLEILVISLKEYTVALAQPYVSEAQETADDAKDTIQGALNTINETVDDIIWIAERIRSILDIDAFLDDMCEGENYIEKLRNDLNDAKKRLKQLSSLKLSNEEVANLQEDNEDGGG